MFSCKFVQGALSVLALFAVPCVRADVTVYYRDAAAAYQADLAVSWSSRTSCKR